MENNNCHFQVGSLVTANFSWQLALPISIGANFGHNPYSNIALRSLNFRCYWTQSLNTGLFLFQ